jgi:hypothetical protein
MEMSRAVFLTTHVFVKKLKSEVPVRYRKLWCGGESWKVGALWMKNMCEFVSLFVVPRKNPIPQGLWTARNMIPQSILIVLDGRCTD